MRKYYYLETKMYSHMPNGYDYQLADGGEMPRIYRYFKRALSAANNSVTFCCEKLGYDIVITNETNPARKDDCKFAVRLINKLTDISKEIRIYAIEINNELPL